MSDDIMNSSPVEPPAQAPATCPTCGTPVRIVSSGGGDMATMHYEPVAAELQAAIDTFCGESEWASPAWKAQPHIARLFELRTKGANDE